MSSKSSIRVFLLCPGLGHINRGFETFTHECFDALRIEGRLDVRLFQGAGISAGLVQALPCLKRTGVLARWIGRRIRRDPYFVEQATFTLSLIPYLILRRPDVVYLSDGAVGNALWHWRRRVGGRFKILFSNGGPLGPPFPRFDHVHQVSAQYYDEAICAGQPAESQTLIPYGFHVPEYFPLSPVQRANLRTKLGLGVDRPVILTVGAVNSSHKRMDYVVREIASLPTPRPTLVILGQADDETAAVLAEANRCLNPGEFVCRSVPAADIGDYYRAADLFVLGSLTEGFGRALVEAQLHGLACLAHDGTVQREVLGDDGRFADLRKPGALATMVRVALDQSDDRVRQERRRDRAVSRFGWDALVSKYVDMIQHCGRARVPASSEIRK